MADFTTLANVRQFIWGGSEPSAGTANDALLTALVSRVTKEIQSFLNRTGSTGTFTEYKDGANGRDTIHVAEWPISSVTTLHESLDQTWDATTLIAASDYLIDKVGGRIAKKYGTPFTTGFQNIRVVYVGGWATTPADVEQVAIELVAMKWEQRSALTLTSKSSGDTSVSYAGGPALTRAMKDRLEPYRNEVTW